ncbi:hypothetical protein L9F63_005185 [Diploptera punctata]|uniref:DUF1279 domain-containing protein n=1 Tax=Diploptera punctata TaxID=6984 RepID=A0AAD7ZDK4_DIPPU|nr:hypothetical protein L9F63_005185 [Diploptera punctata]
MASQLQINIGKRHILTKSTKFCSAAYYSVFLKNTYGKNEGQVPQSQDLHVSSAKQYPLAEPLPLPDNVEEINASQLTSFSPQRVRDISGPVILSKTVGTFLNGYARKYNRQSYPLDLHVVSYDCRGTVSLNSVMQTNVPEPFSKEGRAMHLNMPGGQWGQGQKYISRDMQDTHYQNLKPTGTVGLWQVKRTYSTNADGNNLSRKDKLKRAVKEYGATVIVFHISISLLSLGGFYLAVTSGVDLAGVASTFGVGEVAAEASNFVVAYALHKMLAPVRIGITLAATPVIVRHLRKIGILKAPKTAV